MACHSLAATLRAVAGATLKMAPGHFLCGVARLGLLHLLMGCRARHRCKPVGHDLVDSDSGLVKDGAIPTR